MNRYPVPRNALQVTAGIDLNFPEQQRPLGARAVGGQGA